MTYDATAVISCYNASAFIEWKVKNILDSNANIGIIIVECNGGKELQRLPDNNRIKKIIFDERISIWKAMNIGVEASTTEYVAQANTDDLVHPDAYQKQINKLNEGYDIAYFDYHVIDGFRKTWDEALKHAFSCYDTPDDGYSVGCGLGMFPMWRKSLGSFNENLEIYGDCVFWEDLKKRNKKFGRIPEYLGAYAQRPGFNLEVNEKYIEKDKKYLGL